MRFPLLLTVFIASFLWVHAQNSDTLYFEDFESVNPNFTSTNSFPGGQQWQVNQRLAYQGNSSVKVQPDSARLTTIELITDTFQVRNSDFVRLEWSHIAKLPPLAGGDILVSNNGGVSWLVLTQQNIKYYGAGNVYNGKPAPSFFNSTTYDTGYANNWLGPASLPANNQQWKKEGIDISNVVFGQSNNLIKFRLRLLNQSNLTPLPDGWYLDNIAILRDSCEPFTPQITQSNSFSPCIGDPFRGGRLIRTDQTYEMRVKVDDSFSFSSSGVSGIDSVTVYYRQYAKNSMGSWTSKKMTSLVNQEYKFDFTNVKLGDTIQYYVQAVDNSCHPNTAHFPVIAQQDSSYLFYPEQLPSKCGVFNCARSPGIINKFPWKEDFEDGEWVAGTGNGQSGTAIRGAFANEGIINAAWTFDPDEHQTGYGWAVRTGPTPTLLTGPQNNHTPGGRQYLYIEADQGAPPTTTKFVTPCIDLSRDTIPKILRFYYHRYGVNMPNLRIDIDTGDQNSNYIINYERLSGQSQSSGSDPWLPKDVDLSPFTGKIIRIRFFTAKLSALQIRGDMALDDFSIVNRQNRDVALTSVNDLKDSLGCFRNSSQVPLSARLINLGQQTLDTIPFTIELTHNGSTTVLSDTLQANISSLVSQDFNLNQTLDLSQPGNYQLLVYTNLPQDGNRSNDTALTQSFTIRPAINQFPFVEDFEQGGLPESQNFSQTIMEVKNTNRQLLTWQIGQDFTPKKATGPISGFYRKGKYAYVSADSSSAQHEAELIINRCVDLSALNNPAVSFAYHAYSPAIDKLELQARKAGGNWQVVTSPSLTPVDFSSELSPWKMIVAPLTNFANEKISLRWVVTRKNTTNREDNLALDQVVIYDQASNDLGITAITNPPEGAPANRNLAFLFPSVMVTNYGRSTQNNVNLEMSVRRLCDASGQVNTYHAPNSKVISASGTIQILSQVPLVLEPGACEVCAYVANNSGDANRANDTLCRIIAGRREISTSYKATFDSCNFEEDGFAATDGLLLWEKGIPAGTVINTAQSSPNVWATNLSGRYANHRNEELRTPIFKDLDQKRNVSIRFWQYLDSVPVGRLEYRAGNVWKPVGEPNLLFKWTNWYDGPFGDLANRTFRGSSNGWKFSQAPLEALDGLPGVLTLRFVLEMDTTSTSNQSAGEGWAIDDFEIFIPTQNSVSPQKLVLPGIFPNAGAQPWSIMFKNTGEKTLTNWKVKAFVNGTLQDSTTFTNQSVFSKKSQLISFPRPLNLNNGNNTIMLVSSSPNGVPDEFLQDDTLRLSLPVVAAVDTSQSCSDFETENYLLNGFGISASNLWQRAEPKKASLNTALSGSKVWITDTAAQYGSLSQGSMYTPAYNIEKGQCYQLSFSHQFATERNLDGGTVDFLIPGVTQGWITLGTYDPNDSLWFNTPHIQALPTAQPGWSGSNGSWQRAQYRFAATDSSTVRFRFHFASGASVNGEGWAIDDLCLTHLGSNCDSVVSLNQMGKRQTLKMYPNPASHNIHLEWSQAPTEPGLVQIFNTQGKLMYRQLAWQSQNLNIDVSHWSKGIYIVIVRGAGNPIRRKIVVR